VGTMRGGSPGVHALLLHLEILPTVSKLLYCYNRRSHLSAPFKVWHGISNPCADGTRHLSRRFTSWVKGPTQRCAVPESRMAQSPQITHPGKRGTIQYCINNGSQTMTQSQQATQSIGRAISGSDRHSCTVTELQVCIDTTSVQCSTVQYRHVRITLRCSMHCTCTRAIRP